MSAQMHDKILYDGTEYLLAATPLEGYFDSHPERRPKFHGFNTACMRGYVAKWTVRDGRLYLVDVEMLIPTDATYASIFPDAAADGVFADWVSGDFKCPHGAMLRSVHAGFDSVWERELHMSFQNGLLTSVEDRRNT